MKSLFGVGRSSVLLFSGLGWADPPGDFHNHHHHQGVLSHGQGSGERHERYGAEGFEESHGRNMHGYMMASDNKWHGHSHHTQQWGPHSDQNHGWGQNHHWSQ